MATGFTFCDDCGYLGVGRAGSIPLNQRNMTDDFVSVSHNYWGSGRPASVSDTTTTAVLCPPSGLWIRLHIWSRSDLIHSFNQYRNNI